MAKQPRKQTFQAPKHEPLEHKIQRHIAAIVAIAADEKRDNRKSEGQLHAIILEILGMEPAAHIASIVALASDAKSKIRLHPMDSIKAAEILHRLVYAPLDQKARKPSPEENQFQLSFAWAGNDEVDEAVIIEGNGYGSEVDGPE